LAITASETGIPPALYLLDGACEGEELACAAPGATTASVTVDLRAGQVVTIVVDSLIPSLSGDVTLTVTGVVRATEHGYCADVRDNDGDGRADCADPDCAGVRACLPVETACADGVDGDGDGAADCLDADCCADVACATAPLCTSIPADPSDLAPPRPLTGAPPLRDTIDFLYTGDDPVQRGVDPDTIDAVRASVLRGAVFDAEGPLSGVRVSVLNRPEYGLTVTRDDGGFDLAVNGGAPLTLRFERDGYIEAQRLATPRAGDFGFVDAVILVPYDSAVTTVTMGAASPQVALGSTQSDADGTRRATLLFPAGVTAALTLRDGSTVSPSSLDVRATELTVGPAGPAQMPAPLPLLSAFTYAVELSADEAVAAGATRVTFSEPVYLYVENFIGFLDGGAVPIGYYDRELGAWVPSDDGRVIRIVSEASGIAAVDVDGDGEADGDALLAELGIDAAERTQLAALYEPGASLWRSPIPHFTPWDCNWPYVPPDDATAPPGDSDDRPEGGDEDPDEENDCVDGSVIEVEAATLRERVPVTGTGFELVYSSDRVPGRATSREVRIPVTAANAPASLSGVEVRVSVAGQQHVRTFGPAPGQTWTFAWDGDDAYGRPAYGFHEATITSRFLYPPTYVGVVGAFGRSFARIPGLGAGRTEIGAIRTTAESSIYLDRTWTVRLYNPAPSEATLGGWTLDVQHTYDPELQVLWEGTGTRRAASALSNVIQTFVGGDATGFGGDGGPAARALIDSPRGMALGPDGAFYFGDAGNRRVRRVDAEGVITTYAGDGRDPSFDRSLIREGVPATESSIGTVIGVDFGPDGSLYVGSLAGYVFRVDPEGVITTFAGGGTVRGPDAEGAPATDVGLFGVWDVDALPDGSVLVGEASGRTVRRVTTAGLIYTVAGGGTQPAYTAGVPATALSFAAVSGLLGLPDGSFLVADSPSNTIMRVLLDGTTETFAGVAGRAGAPVEGEDAAGRPFGGPSGLALGPDGSVYVAQGVFIRRIAPDGRVYTVAGNGTRAQGGEGEQATSSPIQDTVRVFVGPDGVVYFDDGVNGSRERIRRLSPPFPQRGSEILLPARDGSQVYVFDQAGRHQRTLHGRTGATLLSFGYDTAGRLTTVTDAYGNATTVERDPEGAATAIVSPFGHRTVLSTDANGWLDGVTLPDGNGYGLTHDAGGLLTELVDPRGGAHAFTYDGVGRLTSDEGPRDWTLTLAQARPGARTVETTTTTAEGLLTTRTVETLPDGARRHQTTHPNGQVQAITSAPTGERTIEHRDGSTTTYRVQSNPRLGVLAPYSSDVAVVTPGGVRSEVSRTQRVEPTLFDGLFAYDRVIDVSTVDGNPVTTTWERATRTQTTVTAAGRRNVLTLDDTGRVVRSQFADDLPTTYEYAPEGWLVGRQQGSRRWELAYDEESHLSLIVDPLGREIAVETDAMGRRLAVTLPGGREVTYAYDEAGFATAITPPGTPTYSLAYSPLDDPERLDFPATGAGLGDAVSVEFDRDGRPTAINRPGGERVVLTYDALGQLASRADDILTRTYAYDDAGFLDGVTTSAGEALTFTRDAMLLTSQTWSGSASGSVETAWGDGFLPSAQTVNGGHEVTFDYDADGLTTRAGAYSLVRDTLSGRVTATEIGDVTSTVTYDRYGAIVGCVAEYDGTALFAGGYGYDDAGRLTSVTETTEGSTRTWSLEYDEGDRLATVTEDGTLLHGYTWSPNGNRTEVRDASGPLFDATFDARDRILAQGTTSFTHRPDGARASRTGPSGATSFTYDASHDLHAVTTPSETVSYAIDGRGRRVARRVDDAATHAWLYGTGERILAELDPVDGSVVARFVYAERYLPVYMVRDGRTLAFVADHRGSPRLLVDVEDGTVAQRMDFSPFGELVRDTNPGLHPFGFAGGHWDSATGLVRFGHRDYDPDTGTWTTPDPLGLRPGATNLYAYVSGDPMGAADPTGLWDWPGAQYVREIVRAGELTEQARAEAQARYGPNADPQTIASAAWESLRAQRDELNARMAREGGACEGAADYTPLVYAEHEAWSRESCNAGVATCASVHVGNTFYDGMKWVLQHTIGDEVIRSDPNIPASPASATSFVHGLLGELKGLLD
jgi:RHS repeat-associated protein